ncbi:hypothetical protein ACKWTF_007707 [Chironomus riparius]
MSDKQHNEHRKKEDEDNDISIQDTSYKYEELNYDDLEQSLDLPEFEFSSPISSISSNCSSPERTVQQEHYQNDIVMDDSDDFVSLEELKSQISLPNDDELCTPNSATLVRKSMLETIYEDVYLETPPGTLSSSGHKNRKRRLVRTDLSKCDEFKENVQMNS